MISKNSFWKVFVFAVSFISLVACSEYLKGKKKEPDVIELNTDRFDCLKKVGDFFEKYSNGESNESEIRAQSQCLIDAITYFKERARGSYPNGYSSLDLHKFFGKYFFTTKTKNPELSEELMKLKAALLGGTKDQVTKDELELLKNVFRALENELVALSSSTPILFWKVQLNYEQVVQHHETFDRLEKSLQKLVAGTQLVKSDYSFADFKKFLLELDKLRKSRDESIINAYLPLVEATKELFIGKEVQLSQQSHWNKSIETVISIYRAASFYRFFLKDFNWKNSSQLNIFYSFIESIVDFLGNNYQMHYGKELPFVGIDQFLDRLEGKKFFKMPLKLEVLKDLYRKVVSGMFEGSSRGKIQSILSLNLGHLDKIKTELHVWRVGQSWIDQTAKDSSRAFKKSEIAELIKKVQWSTILKSAKVAEVKNKDIEFSVRDFLKQLIRPRSIIFDPEGNIQIVYVPENQQLNWLVLTRLNLMHTLTRGLFLGYGNTGKNLGSDSVSEKELMRFYDDFRAFGIAIHAFDPRSVNSGSRSFNEANLFTYSGNGDDKMDFAEGFELISFLVSGGFGINESIKKMLEQKNCLADPKTGLDVFDLPFYNRECFKKNLKEQYAGLYKSVPHLGDFVGKLNDVGWESFFSNIMYASTSYPIPTGLVEVANIRTQVMISLYMESLYIMFDLDRNGLLSYQEVRSASPRFFNLIKTKIIAETGSTTLAEDPDVLADVFTYLVFHGEKPGKGQFLLLQAKKWAQSWGLYDMGEVGRGHIVEVFSYLKDDLKGPTK